jgi:hypothetical protein
MVWALLWHKLAIQVVMTISRLHRSDLVEGGLGELSDRAAIRALAGPDLVEGGR